MPKLRPKLVIIEGHDKGKVIPLQDGTAIIGRTKGDVLVQDARVSRSHVAVHFDGRTDELTFTDLKSLNGTFLNGQAVESGVLRDGDRLMLGSTLFDCQLSDQLQSEPPEKSVTVTPAPVPQFDLGERPSVSEVSISGLSSMEEDYVDPMATREEPRPHSNGPMEMDENPEPLPPPAPKSSKRSKAHARKPTSAPARSTSLWSRYQKLPKNARIAAIVVFLLCASVFLMPTQDQNEAEVAKALMEIKELERTGKTDEAIALAEKARDTYTNRSEPLMVLGSLYTRRGQRERAILAYESARGHSPEQPLTTVRLIPLYLQTDQKAKAQAELQKLDETLKSGNHSRDLFVEAARIFLEFRELKQAPEKVLILSKALQKDLAPESSIGFKLEAQVLFQQNKNGEAQLALEKGLQKSPDDEWILENLAFAKLANRDPAGAKDVVDNWIQMNPSNTKALLVMSYLRYNEQDLDGALPFAQRIVKLAEGNPSDMHLPEAVNLIGLIYWQQGKREDATGWIRRACEMGYQPGCQHEANQGTGAEVPRPPAAVPSTTPSPKK